MHTQKINTHNTDTHTYIPSVCGVQYWCISGKRDFRLSPGVELPKKPPISAKLVPATRVLISFYLLKLNSTISTNFTALAKFARGINESKK